MTKLYNPTSLIIMIYRFRSAPSGVSAIIIQKPGILKIFLAQDIQRFTLQCVKIDFTIDFTPKIECRLRLIT